MSPLETQSKVVLMRSLSEDGNFGLTPVLLNVLNRWGEWEYSYGTKVEGSEDWCCLLRV